MLICSEGGEWSISLTARCREDLPSCIGEGSCHRLTARFREDILSSIALIHSLQDVASRWCTYKLQTGQNGPSFPYMVFFVCVLFVFVFLGGCCCCFYRRLRCHRGFYMFLLNTNTTASMCAQHLRLEELVGPARMLIFPASTPTLPVVEENVPVQ